MTEYWKSNAKKFCTLCKVWYADNRASIEHHESGIKHKQAIQNKLRDLGKQATQKDLASHELQATLASMTAAALGSMRNKDARDANAPPTCADATIGPILPQTSTTYITAPKYGAKLTETAKEMAGKRRQKEEEKQVPVVATRSEFWSDVDVEPEHVLGEKVWVEACSDEGDVYYWHIYSGETEWEPPATGFYAAEEYAALVQAEPEYFEQRRPLWDPGVVPDLSGTGETVPAPALKVMERKPGMKEGEKRVKTVKRRPDSDEDERKISTAEPVESPQVAAPLAGRYMPGVVGQYFTGPAPTPLPMPRIFDPSAFAAAFASAGDEHDEGQGPGDGRHDESAQETIEDGVKLTDRGTDDGSADRLRRMLRKQRGEVDDTQAEREEAPEEKLRRLIAADKVKPFGDWTRVEEKKEEPGKDTSESAVLPETSAETEEALPVRERVVFKEKMVETLAKSKKSGKSAPPVEFKKRKTTAKNLRSRDEDD